MSQNTSLKEVFDKYKCLQKICAYAQERAINDVSSKFAQKIELPIMGKKVKSKPKIHIQEYFDEELQQAVSDYAFLDIVATFEKIVFSKIDNATGEIRKVVREYYKSPAPLSEMSKEFIKDKDDIYNLSGVIYLIEHSRMPSALSTQLTAIREHRNWLAHGKRSIGQQSSLTLQQVYDILQEVVDYISNA
jgi:predicted nucleotidyltransferase